MASKLAALHEQLEAKRLSSPNSALDVAAFVSALRRFDKSLENAAATAIYVDCQLLQATNGVPLAQQRGQDAVASDGAETISQQVFFQVCEEHGLRDSGEAP